MGGDRYDVGVVIAPTIRLIILEGRKVNHPTLRPTEVLR